MLIKTLFFIIATSYSQAVSLHTQSALQLQNANVKFFETAKGHADLARACLGGIMANIPPSFCWKKDWWTGTPAPCTPGTYSPAGWALSLLPAGGLLASAVSGRCFTDCQSAMQMTNCGYFACSADTSSCVAGIAEISFDTLSGAAQAAAFVLSLGTSTAVTPQVTAARQTFKAAVKKVSNVVLLSGAKKAATTLKAQKKTIVDRAVKMIEDSGAADNIANFAVPMAIKLGKKQILTEICTAVADQIISKPVIEDSKTGSYAEKAIDFILDGTAANCAAVTKGIAGKATLNDQIACAKGVANGISFIDPTGLFVIAGTFMRPLCGDAPAIWIKK